MTLKEIRKSKKMTQTELASMLGCKQTTVCGFEKSRGRSSIRLDTLSKYAEALGYTVTIQFGDGNEKINVDGLL